MMNNEFKLRRAGFYETYCYQLNVLGFGTGLVYTICSWNGELCIEKIKQGLFYVWSKHPMLRVRTIECENALFFFDPEIEFNSSHYLRQVDCSLELQEVIKASLGLDFGLNGNKWDLICINSHESGFFVLRCLHEISDACSTVSLCSDLFSFHNDSVFDWDSLTSKDIPLPSDQFLRKNNHASSIFAVEENKWNYQRYSPISSRQCVVAVRLIKSELLLAIFKWCKLKTITINSLLSASLIISQDHILYGPNMKHPFPLLFSTAVNLRDRTDPIIPSNVFGCFVYCAQTVHDPKQDLVQLAKDYNLSLRNQIRGDLDNGVFPDSFSLNTVENDILVGFEKVGSTGKFGEGPVISNLGHILPFEGGKIFATDLLFFTKQVAGDCGVVLSVVTYNDSMNLVFSCPSPLIDEQSINAIADCMLNLLYNCGL